jgi:phage-related protein
MIVKKFYPVFFYQETSGYEPVRKWLLSLDKQIRKIIGFDIKIVQYGWPLGMPLVRSVGNGLFEIRSNLKNQRARIIFVIKDNKIILLHGFIKKTQKILKSDLELAIKRAKNI